MNKKHGIVGRQTHGYFRYQGYPSSVELSDGSIFPVDDQRYGDEASPFVPYTRWTLPERRRP